MLLVFVSLPVFAADSVVIRRDDKPPIGVQYSYYEDWPESDQKTLKIYGETEAETKERQANIPERAKPEVVVEKAKPEKVQDVSASHQIAIMDGKEYVVIERWQQSPGPGIVFIYKEDIDNCKGGH